jgi:hypothetical protein
LQLEIEHLTHEETRKAARFLAAVVGQAHARQRDMPTKKKWQEELQCHRTTKLEAPSWLWASIVELLVSHEGEYLEHCGSMHKSRRRPSWNAAASFSQLLCWLRFASIVTFDGIAHLVYHFLRSLLDFTRGLIDFALLLQSLVISHYAD